MWQSIAIGLIVTGAALYAAWTLLPATLRLRLASRLNEWCGRRAPPLLARAVASLERSARARCAPCSECSATRAPNRARSGRGPRAPE